MLNTQNQTLITIACVRINVIAPINLIKVNRFKHCCASSCVGPDPWTKEIGWQSEMLQFKFVCFCCRFISNHNDELGKYAFKDNQTISK
jgi:hypothetical protein